MKREYIADFDIPKSVKIHRQSVMPKHELIRCKDCIRNVTPDCAMEYHYLDSD